MQQLKYQVVSLIIPYINLSLCAILFRLIVGAVLRNPYISNPFNSPNNFTNTFIIKDLYCTVALLGIGTLWFIPSILLVKCILITLTNAAKSNKNRVIMLLFTLMMFFIFYQIVSTIQVKGDSSLMKIASEEILFLRRIINGTVYACIGFIICQIDKRVNKKVKMLAVVMTIALGTMLYSFDNQMYVPLYVISFTAFILELVNSIKTTVVLKPVAWLGKNSLYIMVIHYIFVYPICINFLQSVFWHNGDLELKQFPLENRFVLFIVVMLVTVIVTAVCVKSRKIQYLFGQGEYFAQIKRRYKNER